MVDAWNISMFFMYSLSSSIRFFISIGIGFVIVFGFFYSFDKSWYKKYPHPINLHIGKVLKWNQSFISFGGQLFQYLLYFLFLNQLVGWV